MGNDFDYESKIWGGNTVRLSPFYLNSLRLKYCLHSLEKIKGKVLEIGCGAGGLAKAIKHYRPDLQVYGCDISHKAIKLANLNNNGVNFKLADAYNLPFSNNSFDAVVMFDVLEHLNNPRLALIQVHRVLKKRGLFHAAIPLEKSLWTIHGLFLKLKVKPKAEYADHVLQFNLSAIKSLLKNTHFSNLSFSYSGHFLEQLLDFGYFFLLSFLKIKSLCTVEGYVRSKPDFSLKNRLLSGIVAASAATFYLESIFIKKVPGQIGHFSAIK